MDPVAGVHPTGMENGHGFRELAISESQTRFMLERGGIMTIYRAASVIG
jgi:hypothetical protein